MKNQESHNELSKYVQLCERMLVMTQDYTDEKSFFGQNTEDKENEINFQNLRDAIL